jgi:hypothetical protein
MILSVIMSTLLHAEGEHWWEAEVHRLRGELRLQQALPENTRADLLRIREHDMGLIGDSQSVIIRVFPERRPDLT